LPHLLDKLFAMLNPALVYLSGVDDRMRNQFRCPNVQFCDEPLEMNQVARECDLAILNGTYTAITMLLAGKPVLQLPIFLEQATCGLAIERLGAGLCAPPHEPDRVVQSLESLLSSGRFAQAAQTFAARYAEYDPNAQIERMVKRAEELATLTPA
jgi:UDP:flavonoid glycosyltransferase YjiC (YdhE family)